MQVSRWGNSLAVRLPAAVVEALGLREGDEVAIEVADSHTFRVARDRRRDEAIEALRALMADQEAPSGLRARAGQMIVALGGTVDVPAAPANAG